MATLVEARPMKGDIVIRDFDQLVNYEPVKVSNGAAAAYAGVQLFGLPVGNLVRVSPDEWTGTIIVSGGEANVEGIIVTPYKFDFSATGGATDETPDRLAVIVRGPAVINIDKISDADPAGDAYDKDALATALLALGLIPRYEPEVVEDPDI